MSLASYQANNRIDAWHSGVSRSPFDDPANDFDNLTNGGTESVDSVSQLPDDDGDLILANEVPLSLWDDLTNKQLGPENTKQWLSKLEQGEDKRIQAAYNRSKQVEYRDIYPKPNVGLVFLPGVDRPTVNRLEEHDMLDKRADQRDSNWRVGTTVPLLSVCTVTKNLTIKTEDHTSRVTEEIRKRSMLHDASNTKRSLTISSDRDYKHTVAIDSDNISVVNELRDAYGNVSYDLCATLIEVDASALIRVITHFQKLVSRSSHATSHDKNQLENMIEDSKFFCTRSPILFRMKSRCRIIDAVDIRYGIDDEQGFKTIYPSKGIQQLISVSAAYFNSLTSTGGKNHDAAQQSIRPRFLQTLCLLLSMLANSDLENMGDFLDSTYGIKAKRQDMELLFLKVIPLASINSKVFLTSLVEAVFQPHLNFDVSQDERGCWETILRELARKGYLLPATIDDLGHSTYSWLMKWPREGIKTNHCFGRLQLHGTTARGFNEIEPVVIANQSSDEAKKVIVYLSGLPEKAYKIEPADYEAIHCLIPGTYILEEPEHGDQEVKLRIIAKELNHNTNEAVKRINAVLPRFSPGSRSRNKISKAMPWLGPHESTLIAGDLQISPPITRHEAWLEGGTAPLAVAWKCEEKTINRAHMLRLMSRAMDRIQAVIERFIKQWHGAVQQDQNYQQVQRLLDKTKFIVDAQKAAKRAPDTPIVRSIHPDDSSGQLSSIWYEYWSNFDPECNYLRVHAQRDLVSNVEWIDHEAGRAKVTLARLPMKFDVAVLRPELGLDRSEEVRESDVVLLLGRYLVVATVARRYPPIGCPHNGEREQMYEMANWLEILSVDEEARPRRGRNKEAVELPLSVFV